MTELITQDKHEIFQKSIIYKQCQKNENHFYENLDYICIDPKCEKQGLVCSICIDEDHDQHTVLSLKSYLCTIYDVINSQGVQEVVKLEDIQQDVDQLYQHALYSLKQLVQSFSDSIRNLEQNLIKKYNNTKDNLSNQQQTGYDLTGVLNQIKNGDISNQEELQKLTSFLLQNTQYDQLRNRIKVVSDPNKTVFSRFQKSMESTNQEISNLRNHVQDVFKCIQENYQSQIQEQEIQFSKDLKGKYIKLDDQNNKIAIFSEKNQVFCQTEGAIVIDKILSPVLDTYIGLNFKTIIDTVQIGLVQLSNQQDGFTLQQQPNYFFICQYADQSNTDLGTKNEDQSFVLNSEDFQFRIKGNTNIFIKYSPKTQEIYIITDTIESCGYKLKLAKSLEQNSLRFFIQLSFSDEKVELFQPDGNQINNLENKILGLVKNTVIQNQFDGDYEVDSNDQYLDDEYL